jgi:hypothetical protein
MVQILERLQAHYEGREMPFATVYEWHPATVDLECECGREGDPYRYQYHDHL